MRNDRQPQKPTPAPGNYPPPPSVPRPDPGRIERKAPPPPVPRPSKSNW